LTKPTLNTTKRAVAAELRRLKGEKTAAAFTAEAFSTTKDGVIHDQQLKLLKSTAQKVLAYTTARAGKTRAALFLLARTALDTTNVSCLYIGITGDQAKRIAWRPWKRLLAQYAIECDHRDAELCTVFPNGSVVYFAGADDVSQIFVYLGESFASGLVVLDEVQDRPDAVIEPLIDDVIEDRLSDVTDEHPTPGRLLLIGTLPRATGGYFHRHITDANSIYEKHNWSRLSNPFLNDQQAAFRRWLEARKLSEDDELARRQWGGEPVWTKSAGRPYRYLESRNAYDRTAPSWEDAVIVKSGSVMASIMPPGCTDVIVAIDLGGADRASIQAIAYGEHCQHVYHVFDYTSERDAHLSWGELMPIVGIVQSHYPVVRVVYDSDASKTEHDTLGRDYGIPLIAAANKTQMVEQVRRLSDLLLRDKVKVMRGSHVADDFTRAQWDQRELAKGKWKLAIGSAKVDASEALRYAIGEWFDISVAPSPPKTNVEQIELMLKGPEPTVQYGPETTDPTPFRGYGPPD
jgi:hypothetical protein